MPFLLLGLGSLAGVFLDNFLDAEPSTEQLQAKADVERAKAENLDKVKGIVQSLAVFALILGALYLLVKSGVLSR